MATNGMRPAAGPKPPRCCAWTASRCNTRPPQHLVTATYRVGFEVFEGERFVLLGPSGCGKSTLLKAIGGFMQPVEGTIRLNGHAIDRPGSDRMMVFQEFDQLLPWKTVLGNVMFPLLVNNKHAEARRPRIMRARCIAKVNLSKFDRHPSAYAVRRHEAARRHRARARDGAGRPADGRAFRCARRADPAQDAGRAGRRCGTMSASR